MGLLDASYSAVNTKKPRKSDRILPGEELNARGLLDAATNVPIAGDALSGVLAAYDAAKGDYGSAAMNALGVLPFMSAGMIKAKTPFTFIRNTAKSPNMGETFGQHIEPAGRYMLEDTSNVASKLPEGWISGKHTFNNPLMIDWGKGGYADADNWKNVLSEKYGGKKGKQLSKAITKDGYDGIVTLRDGETSEVVDLSSFIKQPAKSGLLDDVRPMTEYEKRHEIARQNAVKMLGLPENNTAMDRARAMGAVDAYHGTPNEIKGATFGSQKGEITPTNTNDSSMVRAFASSDPSEASSYAMIGKTSRNPYDEFYGLSVDKRNSLMPLFDEISGRPASRDDVYDILKSLTQNNDLSGPKGKLASEIGIVNNVQENVLPLKLFGKPHVVDWGGKHWSETEMQRKIAEAKNAGADYLENRNIIDSMKDNGGIATSYAILNPAAVRSRFAAFDPARINEPDMMGYADPRLLGLIGGGGLLGLGAYKANQE